MNDDGFLVENSIRLDDAAFELRNAFERHGLLPKDEDDPAFRFYESSPLEHMNDATKADWLKRTTLGILSEKILERSLIQGELVMWTADSEGERQRDPKVLFSRNNCKIHDTLVTGKFIPIQSPRDTPNYYYARLFIKLIDWSAWLSKILIMRYGVQISELLAPPSAPIIQSQGEASSTKNEDLKASLPNNARPNNKRHEEYAHSAAELVRTGVRLSEAIRQVAPNDPMRTEASVQHAIRRTFDLMYDNRGIPL